MADIEFIVLGNSVFNNIPNITYYPRSLPSAAALYWAKVRAIKSVKKKYFCFLDGGEDVLPAEFDNRVSAMVDEMESKNIVISYGDETVNGVAAIGKDYAPGVLVTNPFLIHHAPICNTAESQAMTWPVGCYWFESLCYHRLASISAYYHPGIHYNWFPSKAGARLWPSTARGRINSINFINNARTVHTPQDAVIDTVNIFE